MEFYTVKPAAAESPVRSTIWESFKENVKQRQRSTEIQSLTARTPGRRPIIP